MVAGVPAPSTVLSETAMNTNTTTGCKVCGARCQGDRCADCRRDASAESQMFDFENYECPNCGKDTSGPDTVCYRCRGGGD